MPEWNSIFECLDVLVCVTVNYRFSQGKRVAAVIDNFSNVMWCRFVFEQIGKIIFVERKRVTEHCIGGYTGNAKNK